MIDFACRQFQLEDVIKCAFQLTKADCDVFKFLLKNPDWVTTESLTKKLKLNLSTVQRSVKKLHEKEAIQRTQTNLEGGGYIFLYKIKDKKAIRYILMQTINGWVKHLEKELNDW
jgi:predicted transcriptional regulator